MNAGSFASVVTSRGRCIRAVRFEFVETNPLPIIVNTLVRFFVQEIAVQEGVVLRDKIHLHLRPGAGHDLPRKIFHEFDVVRIHRGEIEHSIGHRAGAERVLCAGGGCESEKCCYEKFHPVPHLVGRASVPTLSNYYNTIDLLKNQVLGQNIYCLGLIIFIQRVFLVFNFCLNNFFDNVFE